MFVQIILLLLISAKVHVTTQDEDDGRELMDYQKQDNWWSLGRKLSQSDECSKEPRDCVDRCYYSRVGRGCGLDDSVQMIGGLGSREAVADDYPFMLSLRRQRENSDLSIIPDCYTHFCGAVLIWGDIALTAAHCLVNDERTVINLDDEPVPTFNSKITASRFSQCRHQKGQDEEFGFEAIVHPEYQQFNKTYNNDIAIIKLFGSMSTEYGFINLWTSQDDVNVDAQILGFGATGFERDITQESTPLKVAKVQSIKSSLCKDLFQDVHDEPWSAEKVNETTMLCSQAYNADTCRGDSGGPLFFKQSDGKDYLLGIVSWGSPKSCQVINVGQPPSVFSRISFYKDWIVQTVNQLTRYPPYQIPQDNQGDVPPPPVLDSPPPPSLPLTPPPPPTPTTQGIVFGSTTVLSAPPLQSDKGKANKEEEECNSVISTIRATSALTTLVTALQTTNLVYTLSDTALVATVLTPTNEAFEKLFETFSASAEEFLTDPQLTNILLYHVIEGAAALSTDLSAGMEWTTLLGQTLKVGFSNRVSFVGTGSEASVVNAVDFSNGVSFVGKGSEASVVTADVVACEAVIHIIDNVLLPDFAAIITATLTP